MVIGLFAAAHAAEQTVLAVWIENAGHPIRPVKADNIIIVPAMLFGWLLGLALQDGQHPKKPENKFKLLLRPVIGIPPLALLLDVAPCREIEIILVITFLTGMIAGLWCSYGAPILFKRIKI